MSQEPHRADDADQGLPQRDVRDPVVLKALAHPVRLRLFDELYQYGPATGSDLALRIGDTQANCSWHLRQLQRYGFVEDAGGGRGRQRLWQVVRQLINIDLVGEPGGASAEAGAMVAEVLLGQQLEALRRWRGSRADENPDWVEAAQESQTWGWLTASELAGFTAELHELVQRHIVDRLDRMDPARRPVGCRPIRHVSWTIPGDRSDDSPAGSDG